MFTLIWLLSFSESLATKWVSLNNESCMIRPTFVVLNLFELNYYPFKINLNKCSGSCNSVDDLSTTTCLPNKTKEINIKVFNMITCKVSEWVKKRKCIKNIAGIVAHVFVTMTSI